ncbi:hypothetical protein [Nocardia sp. NPDC058666]|uniref:hypothetical protein n=1 Tax=unclassified Nocardia TaxID=2637762 RepID=UPI00366192C6
MSEPLRSTEDAIEHITKTVGLYPHYDIDEFEYGWLVTPCPSPAEEAAGNWDLGYSQRIVDARTGMITEFGSSASSTEAIGQYRAWVAEGTPMAATQIYPYRTEIRVHRLDETPMAIEYFTQVRDVETGRAQPAFIVRVDKQTRRCEPTSPESTRVCSWAIASFVAEQAWPTSGTVRY